MHKAFLFVLCFLYCSITYAQQLKKGNTYAVIVGISKYQNPGIRELRFANRDAQMFADYLQSSAGGTVPQDNIRLLIDSSATNAAVYNALSWLTETVQQDDLVYFYFSGHGDMESETARRLGFLLAFNTPRTNYINNAIRIEDLNYYANTLSAKSKAKVILITDACHSGTLVTSDYRLKFLVGNELRKAKDNEIRITSCGPNELAVENEAWGGGRGVFSYYFLNALTGFADADKNGIVTVKEARQYMDSVIAKDPTLQKIRHKQTPALVGADQLLLATVNQQQFAQVQQQVSAPLPSAVVRQQTEMSAQQLADYFFELYTSYSPDVLLDYDRLKSASTENISLAVVQEAIRSIEKLSGTIRSAQTNAGDTTIIIGTSVRTLQLLEKQLNNNNNKRLQKQFNNRLLVAIDNHVQEVINDYLDGAEAELERRRYYNILTNGYDVYPKMLAFALRLADVENPLYKNLQVKYYYMLGVACRLKMPLVENSRSLFDSSFNMQQKAYALEENAAYINHEMGILNFDKRKYKQAEGYFLKAAMISPKWVLPWASLVGLYTATKQFDKAKDAYNTAVALQPGFQNTYVSAGIMHEEMNQWLTAEEMFRKSIKINSRHYLPFERLGYTYLKTTNYAQADSFFFEADVRKRGYFFNAPRHMKLPKPVIDQFDAVYEPCYFDSKLVNENDVAGNFAIAMDAYRSNDFFTAEDHFRKVIALDKTNPLAFHYLGKLYYDNKLRQGAELMFNFSVDYYKDSVSFSRYVDSLQQHTPESPVKECVLKEFIKNYYRQIEDHYFLGTLYEQWNHFTESEQQYRIIIKKQPDFYGGYYLLWSMLEKIDRYQEAEQVIFAYRNINFPDGRNELFSFYKRMHVRLPGEGNWFYKAGKLLYETVNEDPDKYRIDYKEYKPDEDKSSHINRMAMLNVEPFRFETLPGIDSVVQLADKIRLPFTQGIACFLKADSLLTEDEYLLAEINDKLGDLYVWQGLVEDAPKHYQKAIDLQDKNSGIRLKLIDVLDRLYQFTSAQMHLDTLLNRKEINFPKQLLLAKYYAHSSKFKEASELLQQAEVTHVYKLAEIESLFGRIELLSNQPKKAIERYKTFLALKPDNVEAMYSIARIYAKLGNKKEAWRWLQKALDKGFLYSYVLKFDEVWNTYRTEPKWKRLMKNYQFIQYPDPG
ncbi:tetratricopeptide repeat protein [Lacibacter sp.]|uniref:tetratricopeptide repeat protein n=1 Tax=Lacibacter sp. TaxID=1915409 RepID=UPI002B4AD6E8|nr:tetratricopeptide repeat protein [Lacibacter sp.]HLP35512.1 tetratricopeptide repeat protein [Lacibacter sp.]